VVMGLSCDETDAWVALTTERGREGEVRLALPAACAARGVPGVEAWSPELETLSVGGRLSVATLLPGFLLVRPTRLSAVPRLRGWVDRVTGFLPAVGVNRPALMSDAQVGRFRAAVAERNRAQRPIAARPGDRVTVLGGLEAEVLRGAGRRTVVAVAFLGRVVEASVRDLRVKENPGKSSQG
jgi:hypothetical protein